MQGRLRLGETVTKVRSASSSFCQALLGHLRSTEAVSVPFCRSSISSSPALAQVTHSKAARVRQRLPRDDTWWFRSSLVLLDELLDTIVQVATLQHLPRLLEHLVVGHTARRTNVSHPPGRVPQQTESCCFHLLKRVRTVLGLPLPGSLGVLQVLDGGLVCLLCCFHRLSRLCVPSLSSFGTPALLNI